VAASPEPHGDGEVDDALIGANDLSEHVREFYADDVAGEIETRHRRIENSKDRPPVGKGGPNRWEKSALPWRLSLRDPG
jgi:hypothetical protein